MIEAVHWTPAQIAALTVPQWLWLARGKDGRSFRVPDNDPEAIRRVNEWHRKRQSTETVLARAEKMLAQFQALRG